MFRGDICSDVPVPEKKQSRQCQGCHTLPSCRPGFQYYLEISTLRELLVAIVQLAHERLGLLVNDLVSLEVASLREFLATHGTLVWPLPGMSPLVGLE